jgi:hypothetical protein
MSFLNTKMTLEVFNPNLDRPISEKSTKIVEEDVVEFQDIAQLDIISDGSAVVNVDIDVSNDKFKFTVDDDRYSGYANVNNETGFNGYVFTFSELPKQIGSISKNSSSTLKVKDNNIWFDEDNIYINVDAVYFKIGDTLELDVVFLESPTQEPQYVLDIARIYEAALDRQADRAGLNYWIDQFENGTSTLNISAFFINSREFIRKFGAPETVGNDAFVGNLYRNILDREAEQAGKDYWVNGLDNGAFTPEQVLALFSTSPENVASTGYLDNLARSVEGDWIIV